MVITGLLLIALICLGLGLVMQSSVWLVASLIASAGAGFLLYRLRGVIAAPKRAAPDPSAGRGDAAGADEGAAAIPTPATDPAPTGDSAAETTGAGTAQVWVVHGRPRYHLGDCAILQDEQAEAISFEQAADDGFVPCSLCEPHAARTP